jgi:hypothetical protein
MFSIYSEKHEKPLNIFYGQNAEVLDATARRTTYT